MSGEDPRAPEPPRGGAHDNRRPDPSGRPAGDRGGASAGVASAVDTSLPTVDDRGSDHQIATPGPLRGGLTPGSVASWSSWDSIALPGHLAPGQLILGDKYEVVRPLGKGGMGEVWLVHHRVTDADHALKLITQAIAFDAQVRERFRQEAKVMAKFSHPNAVTVHDAMIGQDLAYILMEYVPGRSLHDELKDRPGPRAPDWTARLLKQLCSVLQRAHSRGIVHRDLKPSNLMLVEGEPPGSDLKVLDFGIAKVLDRPDEVALTRTDHFLGTPYYASPEQLKGSRVDGRADLYSVGVLLYELLTGLRPFEGSGNVQMVHHMGTAPPPFAERAPGVDVPAEVEAVVLRCLAKDPADRPQMALDLYSQFLHALPPEYQPSSFSTWSGGLGSSVQVPPARPPDASWESAAPETSPFLPRPIDGTSLPSGPTPVPGASASHEHFHPSVDTPMGPLVAPSSGAEALPVTPNPPSPSRFGFGSSVLRAEPPDGVAPAVAEPSTSAAPRPRSTPVVALAAGMLLLAGLGGGAVLVLNRPGSSPIVETDPKPAEAPPPLPAFPEGYEPNDSAGRHENGMPLELRRTADGVEFVSIEGTGATPFEMGNDGTLRRSNDGDDTPSFLVRLSDYYIQKYEVTIGEIERVLKGEELEDERMAAYRKARDQIRDEYSEDFAQFPAAGVPIDLAATFAERVGGRLPSEAQWEYAARSRGTRGHYVWNDQRKEPGPDLANIGLGSARDRTNVSKPGFFDKDCTEQGVFDLTGSLREWCRNPFRPYEPHYGQAIPDPAADLPPIASIPLGDDGFVIRGSSFAGHVDEFRTTSPRHFRRGKETVDIFRKGAADIGFRVVIELPRGRDDRPALAE